MLATERVYSVVPPAGCAARVDRRCPCRGSAGKRARRRTAAGAPLRLVLPARSPRPHEGGRSRSRRPAAGSPVPDAVITPRRESPPSPSSAADTARCHAAPFPPVPSATAAAAPPWAPLAVAPRPIDGGEHGRGGGMAVTATEPRPPHWLVLSGPRAGRGGRAATQPQRGARAAESGAASLFPRRGGFVPLQWGQEGRATPKHTCP